YEQIHEGGCRVLIPMSVQESCYAFFLVGQPSVPRDYLSLRAGETPASTLAGRGFHAGVNVECLN
ncbi:MAG: hypothetical protein V2B18_18190, partial [Pseudomonadota bacterium]